jgi:hypothetical protein
LITWWVAIIGGPLFSTIHRREIAVARASTAVSTPITKPKASRSVIAVAIFSGIGLVVSLWALLAGVTGGSPGDRERNTYAARSG